MTVTKLHVWLSREISNAPLVLFRMAFGMLMLISTVRFIANGWIEAFYIQPEFHFTYYGFGWVHVTSEQTLYLVFALMLLSAFCIMIGAWYRLSTVTFFLTFTYVELLDKTYYLNHYYFVSLMAFLLIWLPAQARFSFDAWRNPAIVRTTCRLYEVAVLRCMTGILYCYAGMAKINTDWLLKALPLRIWLPANAHLPIIGPLLTQVWVAYLFAWFGAAYDLLVAFALSIRKTRMIAYISVVVFHLLTAALFPIGVFPFVMIVTALIFFPSYQQEKWLSALEGFFNLVPKASTHLPQTSKPLITLFGVFLFIQIVFPWRYLLYPDHLFWHEQGYRFSWRVMLMEKAGMAEFHVADDRGVQRMVDNKLYLSPQQEKMMATQPDMILQYAHYLDKVFQAEGIKDPKVYADVFVALNGRQSRRFIDPDQDLSAINDSWAHKTWVLSYD